MSHFPSSHLVMLFDAQKSAPLHGQRLAKIRYKSMPKTPAKYPSVCASVPYIQMLDVSDRFKEFAPYFKEFLESAQDSCIRARYEACEGNLLQIDDAEIGLDALLIHLATDAAGGRLTKDIIESWYDADVKDYVFMLVADKIGYLSLSAGAEGEDLAGEAVESLTPEQVAKIGQYVKGYKDTFSSLAGGKTVLLPAQIASLNKILAIVNDSDVAGKLKARLVEMVKKPEPINQLLDL